MKASSQLQAANTGSAKCVKLCSARDAHLELLRSNRASLIRLLSIQVQLARVDFSQSCVTLVEKKKNYTSSSCNLLRAICSTKSLLEVQFCRPLTNLVT